ncbi:uncharacterized protein LOC105200367 [Solenopsis invicta]|uniref:uncharacterized protein LOC105200367 n=1 Tax=Solenopsis invicta TaxID=13686 RepID=UPI00193DF691|nr:uncharacterized protein LOC105200367 [Solenopsis invicta]
MSLTSRTNRWASRVIIILQLATWNAVGIVLLHRGVSNLRRRILETNDVVEVNPPTGLESIETMSSTRRDENEYISTQQGSINQNVEIIIQIDPDKPPPRDDKNLFGLSAIKSERLKDAFEIVSTEQRSTFFLGTDPLGTVPTIVRGTLRSRLKNHSTEIKDQRIGDRPENKDVTSKNSRITRDREHMLDNEILPISADGSSGSRFAGLVSRNEMNEEEEKEEEEEDLDLVENVTQATMREMSTIRDDSDQFTVPTSKSDKMRFSRLNENGATMAIALVVIGAIMLLTGPIVIVLRILDERRRARKVALPVRAREDLPPTYEQAVLMDEAPRYSTLTLNYDRTPPSSPTPLSSTYTFSNVAVA